MTSQESPFSVLDAPNVVLDAVEKGEDSGAFVLRLLEGDGEQANARIKGADRIVQARRGNTVEDALEELPIAADGCVAVSFRPFEVVIVILTLG